MAKQKATTEEPLEKQLWKTADKLRKNIDAAEYKHIVLGLIFLKYISDAFEELFAKLKADEDKRCRPRRQRRIQSRKCILCAAGCTMELSAIAKRNNLKLAKLWTMPWMPLKKKMPRLKGVLPKVFARQNLDPTSLGRID